MSVGSNQYLEVAAIANPGDEHWNAVCEQLALENRARLRFNLTDLRVSGFTVHEGCLSLRIDDRSYIVSSQTRVWWRQYGKVDTSDLDDDEARLAQDEGPHLLIGALDAVGAEIIDHPFDIARAEIKQRQLAVARKLDIPVPSTLVTNDPAAARAFADNRIVIAKAVSPGVGIAPYVAEVLESELDAIRTLPTLLQELIPASADLRVVVVNGQSWIWRRRRETGTVDWRRVDPHGRKFVSACNKEVSVWACEITVALGLSMSIQDWLETDNGPVFLESNANGAWLFLRGSRRLVAPAIARHLGGDYDR